MSQADPRTEPIISFIGVLIYWMKKLQHSPPAKNKEITEIEQQLKREDTTRKEVAPNKRTTENFNCKQKYYKH